MSETEWHRQHAAHRCRLHVFRPVHLARDRGAPRSIRGTRRRRGLRVRCWTWTACTARRSRWRPGCRAASFRRLRLRRCPMTCCATTAGVAQIPEPRNDDNVIIAQLHRFWQRFHNFVLQKELADEPGPSAGTRDQGRAAARGRGLPAPGARAERVRQLLPLEQALADVRHSWHPAALLARRLPLRAFHGTCLV